MRPLLCLLLLSSAMLAQVVPSQEQPPAAPPSSAQPQDDDGLVTVPTGTKVLLSLRNPITTKTAKVGDGVYLQTIFPVVMNDQIVIPPGTYVQGRITNIVRPGRVKGRAQLLLHFNTMIFPNGYTVTLPGALDSVSGAEDARVKDNEGTMQAEGTKGRDLATVGTIAATGAGVGAMASGGRGAGYGGLAGAAVGTVATLFTRGQDIRIEQGTSVEMVLQRPLVLEEERVAQAGRSYAPLRDSAQPQRRKMNQQRQRLPMPGSRIPLPN